jgi:hypothetical protein
VKAMASSGSLANSLGPLLIKATGSGLGSDASIERRPGKEPSLTFDCSDGEVVLPHDRRAGSGFSMCALSRMPEFHHCSHFQMSDGITIPWASEPTPPPCRFG